MLKTYQFKTHCSPGKMIFAVLELWVSPLQWVLNW